MEKTELVRRLKRYQIREADGLVFLVPEMEALFSDLDLLYERLCKVSGKRHEWIEERMGMANAFGPDDVRNLVRLIRALITPVPGLK